MYSRIIGVRVRLVGLRWGGARQGLGLKPHSSFLLALRAGAGVCARRRSNFLSLRRKKVTKERATLLSVMEYWGQTPISLRCFAPHPPGAPKARWNGALTPKSNACDARSRGALRNSLRAFALRSNSRSESVNEGVCPSAHARPAPCASRHGQKGPRQYGPSLRSAPLGQALRAAKTRPSAAMARVVPNPLLDAPVAECLRGGMRVGARMLRQLIRRICPNEALQARSELCGAPRKCFAAGCPVAQRRGRRQQGRLLFGDFLLATKRKLLRRRAHTPAPALKLVKELESDPNSTLRCQAHTPTSVLSKNKQSKNIAASAYPISARAQKHPKSTSRGQL